jgi:hypothetical protein
MGRAGGDGGRIIAAHSLAQYRQLVLFRQRCHLDEIGRRVAVRRRDAHQSDYG